MEHTSSEDITFEFVFLLMILQAPHHYWFDSSPAQNDPQVKKQQAEREKDKRTIL